MAVFGYNRSDYLTQPKREYPSWAKPLPNGRVAIYLDNYLLSAFTECEQKFSYRHVGRYVPKGQADKSAKMELGIWWSETLERFYRGMMNYQKKEKDSKEPSDLTLVRSASEAWANLKMAENPEKRDGTSFQERYPIPFDRFGGEEGAIVMAGQYWDTFGEWDARHWRIIAMELGFGLGDEVLLYEDKELAIYWCGRPDLVVYEDQTDLLMPVDHKTEDFLKSEFIQKWKPHNQTCGYVFALNRLSGTLGFNREVDRCVINGAARLVALNPKKERARFLRPRPHYSQAELMEFVDQTVMKVRNLWDAYTEDIWIKNDKACHIYKGCFYRGICNQAPATRPIVIESSYNVAEPWVPYKKDDEEAEDE